MTNVHQPRIYDLLYPSPLPLENIATMSIAAELWRKEINEYRIMNALDQLDFLKNISLDYLIPYTPSALLEPIKKYSETLGSSIKDWLDYHCKPVFKSDRSEVLKKFDDFVCDFDGSVNCGRTAKRVILSDRFNDVDKFIIACLYCFEEDIMKRCSSVTSSINIDEYDNSIYTFLYYWAEAEQVNFKINHSDTNWTTMLLQRMRIGFNTSTTIDYLWKKLDAAGHVAFAIKRFESIFPIFLHSTSEFCRYVLPKLDEQELDAFLLAKGDKLIPFFLENSSWKLALPVWRLVKNKISESGFICTVRKIFEIQANYDHLSSDTTSCCEIWQTAADNLKRIAIQDVLSDSSLFVRNGRCLNLPMSPSCRQNVFLFTVLSDTTIEERKSFWNTNWSHLILGMKTNDLGNLMNICLRDKTEIDKFKKMQLSNFEVIATCCCQFLERGDFQGLNEFLNFCCQEEEIKKYIKSRLLSERFKLQNIHILKVSLLDEFIKSTFDDEGLVAEFKNYLSMSLADDRNLMMSVLSKDFRQVMEFVDTMVLSEEVVVDLKKRLFSIAWKYLFQESSDLYQFRCEEWSSFMRWCLGDDEKIAQIKQTLPPIDEIVRRIVDGIISSQSSLCCRKCDLDEFLKWYFENPETLAEFKMCLADVFEKINES